MQQTLEQVRDWIDADAPVIWLLGKTQAGKTSIVAEMTGQAHDQIGAGYLPMTRESRVYAFPPEHPVLRFLDTRGLGDDASYDPHGDLALAEAQAHLVMVVQRVDDLELDEILTAVRQVRRQHPDRPLIVAQTGLHRRYGRHDRHPVPYPFDGGDDDARRPGVPDELGRVMLAQRRLFDDLPGRTPPIFVPLDFTRPEQGIAPADYGAERLWDVLEQTLPDLAARLKGTQRGASLQQGVRSKLILPWAVAASTANALPAPVIGGLGSASLQAAMVTQIAQRLGFPASLDLWREFATTLGAGLTLGFAGSWAVQQVLKLGLGWGTAVTASWTFAITWGIGEAALYYFGEKAAGREPDRATLEQRYGEGLRQARQRYAARKGGSA
jgi:uncharacterized protein (DUF697 family)